MYLKAAFLHFCRAIHAPVDPVMVHSQAYLPFRNAQTPGRRRHVPARNFQCFDDELLLKPRKGCVQGRGGFGVGGQGGLETRRQMIGVNHHVGGENDSPLDTVFQLPDVSRPMITRQ